MLTQFLLNNMTWIQENKFAVTLLGVSAVASGALFYVGMNARTEAKLANQYNIDAIRQVNCLKNAHPYPNADNRTMVKQKVAAFVADAYAFQQELLKFRPAEMPSVSPGDFNQKVGEYVKQLKAYYTEKGVTLPQVTSFGLEAYDRALADKSAIRELEYERNALDWLFKSLADAAPTSLKNVHRQSINAEKNAGVVKRNSITTRSNKVESVYQAMPIELTFTGSEQSLKAFLTTLSKSKGYFFAVRAIRLQNEDTESPDLSKAEFAKKAVLDVGEDIFGAALGESDDFAETTNEKVIKKLVGDEKLVVYLKLDLLLFKEAKKVKILGDKPRQPVTTKTNK